MKEDSVVTGVNVKPMELPNLVKPSRQAMRVGAVGNHSAQQLSALRNTFQFCRAKTCPLTSSMPLALVSEHCASITPAPPAISLNPGRVNGPEFYGREKSAFSN